MAQRLSGPRSAALAAAMSLGACAAPPAPLPMKTPEPPPPSPAPVAVPAAAAASPAAGLSTEALAREIAEALAARAFDRVVARFDAAMTAALPARELAAAWEGVEAGAGAFQAVESITVERRGAAEIGVATCRFAKGAFDVRVTVGVERRVSGLFFRPTPAPYDPPAYATPGAFTERDLTVNPGEWALPATLTTPRAGGPFPAVVLVHGSGPNDRDESIGPSKPFKDLAWGLASRGVAVLRYEKRTRAHGGKFAKLAAFTVAEETVDDALAAAALLRTLPEIDPARVFLAGHSLGGELVPRIAARDAKLAGLIVLAGSTRPLPGVMLEQLRYIFGLSGGPTADQQARLDEVERAARRIAELARGATPTAGESVLGIPVSYWMDLEGYDAPALAEKLPHPILVLQGGRDYQVTEVDFARWKKALSGRKNARFELYPALNHIFATGTGKATPAEYARLGYVDEAVVRDVAEWILGRPR